MGGNIGYTKKYAESMKDPSFKHHHVLNDSKQLWGFTMDNILQDEQQSLTELLKKHGMKTKEIRA